MGHFTNKHCVSTVCVSSIKKSTNAYNAFLENFYFTLFYPIAKSKRKETERAKEKRDRKSKKNYGVEVFANEMSKFQKRLDQCKLIAEWFIALEL